MTARQEDHNLEDDVLQLEAMNTAFYIKVIDRKEPDWKRVISDWIQYADNEWSRFQRDNELSRLNQLKMGEQMEVSPPLFDLLVRTEEYRKKTKGLFSPYLFPQMHYHGYGQSFPFTAVQPQAQKMPDIYNEESPPYEFQPDTGSIKRTGVGKVDLGGIAKGYTVQSAVQWLKDIGKATAGIVDGGGDMTVWSDGEKEWKIGVENPLHKGQEITQFRIKNGSIATSNIVYRSWQQGAERKHHILNGKTGLPVESSIIQATVVSENCLDAEVGAKLCFMVNENEIETELHKLGTISSFLLVKKDGKIIKK